MSKILVLFFAPLKENKLVGHYDNLATSLESRGHTVLAFNLPINPKQANFQNLYDAEQKISNFKPDLILSYNHIITENIYRSTNCPVVIMEADSFQAFHNKRLVEKYQDRIYMAIFCNNRLLMAQSYFEFIPKEKLFYFKAGTSLKPENLDQDINISFLGTLCGADYGGNLVKNLLQNYHDEKYLKEVKKIFNKALYNIPDVTQDEYSYLGCNYGELFALLSYYKRMYILDSIASLGLQSYGQFYIDGSIVGLRDLFFTLKNDVIISAKENQDLYNRSKIAINAHFAHNALDPTKSGYSWRVCDIMATNACLVSEKCPALDQDFGKWVKIPQFENKHDAYDLCKKLLSEDNWRSDIVSASQLAIKEGKFTMNDAIIDLEDRFKLSSQNTEGGEHEYIIVESAERDVKPKKRRKVPRYKKTLRVLLLRALLNIKTIVRIPSNTRKLLKKYKLSKRMSQKKS